MTDQQKLIEEAAKVAFAAHWGTEPYRWHGGEQERFANIATAMRDFWASHAEPEMGMGEVLRRARDADFGRLPCTDHKHDPTMITHKRLSQEIDRLDAATQQRERDVRIGRAISAWDDQYRMTGEQGRYIAELGKAAREAVEAEK